MNRFSLVSVLIAVGILLASPAAGEDRRVRINTITDYPPFCMSIPDAPAIHDETIPPGKSSAQLQGYSWDVVRASCHEMGYTIVLSVVPAARCLHNAKAGHTDLVFPAGKNPEREETFHFSRESVNPAEYVIYVRADSGFDYDGLDSLAGQRIAVLRDWSYGDRWAEVEGIITQAADTIPQCFRMLDRGRVVGVAGYNIPFDFTLKKAGIAENYRKLPPFGQNFEYLIGRKDPSVQALLADFDTGKQRLMDTGRLQQLLRRWQ